MQTWRSGGAKISNCHISKVRNHYRAKTIKTNKQKNSIAESVVEDSVWGESPLTMKRFGIGGIFSKLTLPFKDQTVRKCTMEKLQNTIQNNTIAVKVLRFKGR